MDDSHDEARDFQLHAILCRLVVFDRSTVTQSKMERALKRLRGWFEDQGLAATDIPVAIVAHEVLGTAVMVAAWALCWAVQPSQRLMAAAFRNNQ